MKIYPLKQYHVSPRTGKEFSIDIAYIESKNLSPWDFLKNVLEYLINEDIGHLEMSSIISQLEQLHIGFANSDNDFEKSALYQEISVINERLKHYYKEKTVTGKRKIEREMWSLLYYALRKFLSIESNQKYFEVDVLE
ncbi:hypothetical protein [Sphingobacterium paludis]|uniref:Uncharacterized protein n=1 Tax=Sphingobacterium paludis TaxID=1476465 RepID=A0A4R7CRB0_9SPHI|nr:hypothetical protein [Sphingobacterium paludis]TDS06002.1 hypothetical protein B0I21_11722 [Sphingobacterium paludis]